jgi:AcrR family transcriptional regulator
MSEPVDAADAQPAEPTKRTGRGGRRAGAGRPRRADADDLILDTTLELLDEHGYGNFRVDDVAARTGIAKSTIYRRWPSKSALVAASVQLLYLGRVTVPDTGSLRTDLTALLTNSYQLLIKGSGRVFEGLIRESGQRPELVDVVAQTMHARRRFYFHVFNRAIARGEIPPETDTGLAIDLLLGPLWVRLLTTREPIQPDTVHATVHAVLDGLLHPTTHPHASNDGTDGQA